MKSMCTKIITTWAVVAGDISILKLSESLPPFIFPAILPQALLDLQHEQLHVAIHYKISFGTLIFRKMMVPIWPNDECAQNKEHDAKKNLMCIDVIDACDHFMVKKMQ